MELKGKKIAFLGDSITEGCGVADIENVYWKRLEKNTGAVSYGYGIGGTGIAIQKDYGTEGFQEYFAQYFGNRVDQMIPDADLVVVFGGTNDFGHGDAGFGTMTDRSEDTFCGAFHVLLEKLLNRYPEAQIVVMTPLHRSSEKELGVNEFGLPREHLLKEYVDAEIEICGEYGIPVLDLFRTGGMQPSIPVLKERYMPDGLHPNDLGHKQLAERLQGFLSSL